MSVFYVHYDSSNGVIHTVGPLEQSDDFPHASVMKIDEETVLKFHMREWLIDDWFVGVTSGVPMLIQNQMDIVPEGVGEMMGVPRITDAIMFGITATLRLPDDMIEFTIPDRCKGKIFVHVKDTHLTFVLTKRNDPTYVITEFVFPVSDLFMNGRVAFPIKCDLKDYSLFTTRVFNNYQFEVSRTGRGISQRQGLSRFNKLVAWKKLKNPTSGIKVFFNKEARTLDFEALPDSKLTWPDGNICPIFITKLHDPTIVYGKLVMNVESFWENKKISLQLPEDIHGEFGVASFPLAESMTYVKVNNDKPT